MSFTGVQTAEFIGVTPSWVAQTKSKVRMPNVNIPFAMKLAAAAACSIPQLVNLAPIDYFSWVERRMTELRYGTTKADREIADMRTEVEALRAGLRFANMDLPDNRGVAKRLAVIENLLEEAVAKREDLLPPQPLEAAA